MDPLDLTEVSLFEGWDEQLPGSPSHKPEKADIPEASEHNAELRQFSLHNYGNGTSGCNCLGSCIRSFSTGTPVILVYDNSPYAPCF